MESFLLIGAIEPVAILLTCIIGAVCGFLAGQLMKGRGFGLIGNMIVGIVGAAIFSFLFGNIALFEAPWVNEIIGGTVGAVILLGIIGIFKKAI